jgi:hypothetical protein
MYFLLCNNDSNFLAMDTDVRALLKIADRLKQNHPENNYQIVNRIEFDNYYKTY